MRMARTTPMIHNSGTLSVPLFFIKPSLLPNTKIGKFSIAKIYAPKA